MIVLSGSNSIPLCLRRVEACIFKVVENSVLSGVVIEVLLSYFLYNLAE